MTFGRRKFGYKPRGSSKQRDTASPIKEKCMVDAAFDICFIELRVKDEKLYQTCQKSFLGTCTQSCEKHENDRFWPTFNCKIVYNAPIKKF